ncbi:hypothetical protein D9M68_927380 [compost metagenome]
MQAPQPRHVMAEPVHGVETEVQDHRNDKQLAPLRQVRWKGADCVRHPIAQPSQHRGGELDDGQVYEHVQQVGQGVLVIFQPLFPKGLQALQHGH